MATQNRRDFFKTVVFIGASAASFSNVPTHVEEKTKLSQDRISVFVYTAKSNDCSFCMFVFFRYTQFVVWNLKSTVSYSF
jgi:hypothetical protein